MTLRELFAKLTKERQEAINRRVQELCNEQTMLNPEGALKDG